MRKKLNLTKLSESEAKNVTGGAVLPFYYNCACINNYNPGEWGLTVDQTQYENFMISYTNNTITTEK